MIPDLNLTMTTKTTVPTPPTESCNKCLAMAHPGNLVRLQFGASQLRLCRDCAVRTVVEIEDGLCRMLTVDATPHRDGPPGSPADWGEQVCKCGHQRRSHLHGTQHGLEACGCKAFTQKN